MWFVFTYDLSQPTQSRVLRERGRQLNGRGARMAFGTTVPMKLSSVSCPITSIARLFGICPMCRLANGQGGWGSLSFSHGIVGGLVFWRTNIGRS